MNNPNKIYSYLSIVLSLVLTFPGRFAFGLLSFVHFNILVVLTVLTIHGIKKMNLGQFVVLFVVTEIASFTVLFRQILNFFCPVASLSLSFALYVSAASSTIIPLMFSDPEATLKNDLVVQLKSSLCVTAFCLLIFLFRDLVGFASITFPVYQDIYVLKLPFFYDKLHMLSFFGTIPGTFLILGIILFFVSKYFKSKKNI